MKQIPHEKKNKEEQIQGKKGGRQRAKNGQPSSEDMLSHTQNSWRSNTMISTEFLEKISHFHSFFKVIILQTTRSDNGELLHDTSTNKD